MLDGNVAQREETCDIVFLLVLHKKAIESSEVLTLLMWKIPKSVVAKDIKDAIVGLDKIIDFFGLAVAATQSGSFCKFAAFFSDTGRFFHVSFGRVPLFGRAFPAGTWFSLRHPLLIIEVNCKIIQ